MNCLHIVRRKRDTYRYTGRGKTGFEMHYTAVYCKLKALSNGYCKRHQPHWAAQQPEMKGER